MKMKLKKYFSSLCLRWSATVPFICYACFFLIIWSLALPLKSEISAKTSGGSVEEKIKAFNYKHKFKPAVLSPNNQNVNSNEVPLEIKTEYDKNIDPAVVLKEVFKKVDTDNNQKVDTNELSKWINFKIKQHIAKAVRNNYGLFTQIDVNPRNGVVTWEEYHSFFLKQKGLSSKYVREHDEKKHVGLQRSLKEQIMRDKAYWQEAARFDPDSLTVDEFLAFTHPESSATNQLALVDELYEKFDRDGDEILTEDEFAVLLSEDESSTKLLQQSENERRIEFRNSIDVNKDGRADRRELLRYVAPQNPRRSELEAQTLISLADVDHDDALSLSEILARPDLFMASKMIGSARSFHDEF